MKETGIKDKVTPVKERKENPRKECRGKADNSLQGCSEMRRKGDKWKEKTEAKKQGKFFQRRKSSTKATETKPWVGKIQGKRLPLFPSHCSPPYFSFSPSSPLSLSHLFLPLHHPCQSHFLSPSFSPPHSLLLFLFEPHFSSLFLLADCFLQFSLFLYISRKSFAFKNQPIQ